MSDEPTLASNPPEFWEWKETKGPLVPPGQPLVSLTYEQVTHSMELYVSYTFNGQNITERVLDIGVDSSTLPVGNFLNEYLRYRFRNIPEGCAYGKLVDAIAENIMLKIGHNDIDVFVAIPTRREVNTARAVGAINSDLMYSSGEPPLNPFFVVLHNDIDTPSQETTDDLAKLRDRNNCLVIDIHFGQEDNIGIARAILADAIMCACYKLGITPPLVTADADIAYVYPGSYSNLIKPILENPSIAAVIGNILTDFQSIEKVRGYAFLVEVYEAIKVAKFNFGIPEIRGTSGAFTAINLAHLARTGNFLRVNMGEDLLKGAQFRNLFGKQCVINAADNTTVYVSGDRHARAFSEGRHRYDDWQNGANKARNELTISELDQKQALLILNDYFTNLMILINGRYNYRPLVEILLGICNRYELHIVFNPYSLTFEEF